MTKYEKVVSYAQNLGLDVIETTLEANDGFYCDDTIFINKDIETNAEKYCVINEELGHHFTSSGDITNQTKLENKKQELIARRWGYDHTVSLIGLIEAFEYGLRYYSEVAEFLGVTESYLHDCIEDYQKQYGEYIEIEQYCIIFIPNLRIIKNMHYRKVE